MVKRAASKGLDIIPSRVDSTEVKVYFDGTPVGVVHHRGGFEASYHGQLVVRAATVEQAAEALVNHSK